MNISAEIRNQAAFISTILGISIFLLIIVIAACIYNSMIKNTREKKNNPNEWLFHNFSQKMYGAFFGNKDPDEAAISLGLKIEDYYKNCELLGIEANVKKIVINYIYGFMYFLLSCVFAMFFNALFIIVGFILFFLFSKYDLSHTKSKADDMRIQVKKELPQFLELLSTELEIGMPVDKAISVLSEKYDCLLSKEFLHSLNDVKLGGTGGWQAALESVASKYEIDLLSDFVLDITVAFDKGVSVAQSVRTKTKDIKQKHFFDLKEQAGKTENTILIPIALLQFVPMLVFVLLPTILSVANF